MNYTTRATGQWPVVADSDSWPYFQLGREKCSLFFVTQRWVLGSWFKKREKYKLFLHSVQKWLILTKENITGSTIRTQQKAIRLFSWLDLTDLQLLFLLTAVLLWRWFTVSEQNEALKQTSTYIGTFFRKDPNSSSHLSLFFNQRQSKSLSTPVVAFGAAELGNKNHNSFHSFTTIRQHFGDFITAPYDGNQQMSAEGETGNSPHPFTPPILKMRL